MAAKPKCLTCGDQPLLRDGCATCGGTGRRSKAVAAPRTRAAPVARSASPAFVVPAADDFDLTDPEEGYPVTPVTGGAQGGFTLSLPPMPGPFTGPLDALQRLWGYQDFRPGQRQIVESIAAGEDLLVVAPTSFGKTVVFQVPAVLRRDAPVVVISPLIALMRDQVGQALQRGIPAVAISSQYSPTELRQVYAEAHRAQLVYAAPERLDDPRFRDLVERVQPWLIALDEVHSVGAEAGLSFRPAYRFVQEMMERSVRRIQWLGVTASATPDTVADVRERLRMPKARLIRLSCHRPNLSYGVEILRREEKLRRVYQLVKENAGQGAAIVYTLSRKDAEEEVAPYLRAQGVNAVHYHAGMKPPDRRRVEQQFFGRDVPVVVSTCAFGMGIDRPDVRLVVMHGMPKSIEDYYQSMGRAGRDQKPARCVALYDSSRDYSSRRWLIDNGRDLEKNDLTARYGWTDAKFAEAKAQQHALLRSCDQFLRSRTCRVVLLRRYFGEEPGQPCETCDNCQGEE